MARMMPRGTINVSLKAWLLAWLWLRLERSFLALNHQAARMHTGTYSVQHQSLYGTATLDDGKVPVSHLNMNAQLVIFGQLMAAGSDHRLQGCCTQAPFTLVPCPRPRQLATFRGLGRNYSFRAWLLCPLQDA